MTEIEQIAAECGAVIGYTGPGGELAEAAFSRKGLHEFARRLATPPPPKPAGAVPFPEFPHESDGTYWSTLEIDVIRAYGDAREAAAVAVVDPWATVIALCESLDIDPQTARSAPGKPSDVILEAARRKFSEAASIIKSSCCNICNTCVDSAGRADAVPALDVVLRERGLPRVGDALGYSRNFAAANPALSQTTRDHIEGLCSMLEIAARHPAPQPMTTQGEAVAVVADQSHPLYGPTREEAWRTGFKAAIRHARGAIYQSHKQTVQACNTVGIVNPHRGNCDGMEAFINELEQRIQAVSDRILKSTGPQL